MVCITDLLSHLNSANPSSDAVIKISAVFTDVYYSVMKRQTKKSAKAEEKKPAQAEARNAVSEELEEAKAVAGGKKESPSRVDKLRNQLEQMKKSDRIINVAVVLVILLLYLVSFLWRERRRSQFVSAT